MEKTIISTCMRERIPLPDRIANAPSLQFGLELYFVAFQDLDTCRAGSGGPITWLAISEYADRIGLEDEQKEDLLHHVQKLDSSYMKHLARKNKGK